MNEEIEAGRITPEQADLYEREAQKGAELENEINGLVGGFIENANLQPIVAVQCLINQATALLTLMNIDAIQGSATTLEQFDHIIAHTRKIIPGLHDSIVADREAHPENWV